MHVADLQRLYDYDRWANEKMLRVVSQLTPEQFTQSVAGSYGSIRNTLVHVVSAEWGWIDRCGGHPRGERLKPESYPTAPALVSEWKRVEEFARELLSALRDEDLSRNIEFALGGSEKQSATLGDLMQHAVIHAIHHRGQVSLLLRALGHTPGNFDMLIYVEEQKRLSA
jgi:uncharacterized damage-inducible protein DinB